MGDPILIRRRGRSRTWHWALVGLALTVALSGCRRGVPVIDTGERPPQADGTISGTVRSSGDAVAMEGRVVEAINLETRERQQVTTNAAGGFTFKVKPGRYRVELTLLNGETLLKQPGVISVNPSDVDAHADFVIGGPGAPAARPRGPAMRMDLGLGSPIA